MTATTATTRFQTMAPDEAMALKSGDYDGLIMSQVMEAMARAYAGEDYYASRAEREHGGPVGWIEWLADDMRMNGWDGWPIKVVDGVVRDGHHRVIAAHMAGLKEIPHSTKGGYSWESMPWRDTATS